MYVIGLITNDRHRRKMSFLADYVEKSFDETGEKQREFIGFWHQAGSYLGQHRVVSKVERLEKGLNQRFVVPNLVLEPHIVHLGSSLRETKLKTGSKNSRTSCRRICFPATVSQPSTLIN